MSIDTASVVMPKHLTISPAATKDVHVWAIRGVIAVSQVIRDE